jgi:urease accessory protein
MQPFKQVSPRCTSSSSERFGRREGSVLNSLKPARTAGPESDPASPELATKKEAPLPPTERAPDPHGLNSADAQSDWVLWQLADSAFPAGGFAHSGGLEAAVQQGELRDLNDLRRFIEASLCQFGHAALPFMTAAYDHPERWLELDQLSDCFTTNHVAKRASCLQGHALLASAERIFTTPRLQHLKLSSGETSAYVHLAPVFGVILRELCFSRSQAARLFFFLHLRGLVSAAVRLGVVGPLQGQALQHRLAAQAEEMLFRFQNLSLDEVAQTAPLLDLWQANHDRLYSRLFQS